MAIEVLRLTNTTDGYEYDIRMIQDSNRGQTKDAFSISPPGSSPRDNILMGVSGMQSDVRIRFAMHDNGEDKANGTAPADFTNSTVVTLAEQRRWLQEYMHAPTFSARWELDHVTGGMVNSLPVFVESVDIPLIQQDSRKWLEATIALRVGESV